jgi:hypothetical protein
VNSPAEILTMTEPTRKSRVGTYVLRCYSKGGNLDYDIEGVNEIDAMLRAGKRLLQLRRLKLCQIYELFRPDGTAVGEFKEFMENGA